MQTQSYFENTQQAIRAIRAGKMVILIDDEDRENEGDLVMAAQCVTPEDINFMAKHGRGLICLTATEERLAALNIPMMVEQNSASFGTAFTVSIEARTGVSTGISAQDRAHTIQVAIADHAQPHDVVMPGHIFPLKARKGGVLVRTGQTEGSVDLARLAGLKPAGVICEIMNDDGTMARRAELEQFARTHGLLILTIAELIQYRLVHDQLVHKSHSATLIHQEFGPLKVHVYRSEIDALEHLVVALGEIEATQQPVLVRVHSGSHSDNWLDKVSGEQSAMLNAILRTMHQAGSGVLVLLSQPTSSAQASLTQLLTEIGHAPTPQPSREAPHSPATMRDFGVGAQILRDLGLTKIRLLSNHPRKMPALEGFGLQIEETLPLPEVPSPFTQSPL